MEASSSEKGVGNGSESTIDINIKTLDSQIHKLRVTKDMPVIALKEKIVELIGVPCNQQRLIFRGRVLKDEHLLSEYRIEDGHTMHLVARHPTEGQHPSGVARNTGDESTGNAHRMPGQHSVTVGTVNLTDGERVISEIARNVVEALNSQGILTELAQTLGVTGGSVAVPADTNAMSSNTPLQGATNMEQGGQHNSNVTSRSPPVNMLPQGVTVLNHQIQMFPFSTTGSFSQPMFVPDSLATILQYVNRMERAMQNTGDANPRNPSRADDNPSNFRGPPSPTMLATVIDRTRHLLTGRVASSLSHIARRLHTEASSTDVAVRSQIQAEATHLGLVMHHLGAMLMELGRATMLLRMGQTPAEAFVNAGPPLFINVNGPNPVMVQPSLNPGPLIGPSNYNPILGSMFGPFGAFDPSRNISVQVNPGNASQVPQAGIEQTNQSTDNSADSTLTQELPQAAVLTATPPRLHAAASNHVVSVILPVHVRSQPAMGQSNPPHVSNPTATQPNAAEILQPSSDSGDIPVPHIQDHLPSDGSNSNLCTQDVSTQCRPEISSSGGTPSNLASENPTKMMSQVSSSSQQGDNEKPAAPLGLGHGSLQPKKRSKSAKPKEEGALDGSLVGQNPEDITNGRAILRSLASQGTEANRVNADSSSIPGSSSSSGQQLSLGNAMSNILQNPALSGLLANVASHATSGSFQSHPQAGVGSAVDLGGMMEQCLSNPAIKDMLDNIVQPGRGPMEDQFSGAGGAGSGGGGLGGIDFSRMIQQMMPVVSQVLGGGAIRPASSVVHGARDDGRNEADMIDFLHASEQVEREAAAGNIFNAVLERAGDIYGRDDAAEIVEELGNDPEIASEYINYLLKEGRGRQEQGGGDA